MHRSSFNIALGAAPALKLDSGIGSKDGPSSTLRGCPGVEIQPHLRAQIKAQLCFYVAQSFRRPLFFTYRMLAESVILRSFQPFPRFSKSMQPNWNPRFGPADSLAARCRVHSPIHLTPQTINSHDVPIILPLIFFRAAYISSWMGEL